MLTDAVYRRLAYIAFASMALLLFGSLYFYQERIIFTDASLVSFRRINLQDLESSQRRWGAFITEIVPLLLSKLCVPLRFILIAYSLSFNIFYLLVMSTLVFRWRLYLLSLLFASYYLLFVSAGYYWTNNEIHQAVAYIFLCVGWSFNLKDRNVPAWQQYVFFTLLSGLAIFTHPLSIVAFLFLWGVLWIDKRYRCFDKRQATFYTVIIVSWAVIKIILSSTQAYDARRMNGLTHPDLNVLLHGFTGKVARQFYKACFINYWMPALLSMISVGIALWQKKWPLSAWITGFAFGLLFLVHCAFPDGHFLYYLEGEWQTMGIIAGASIFLILVPSLKPKWATTLIALLFMTRLTYIAAASKPFTQRVRFIERLNDYSRRHGLNKVLIQAQDSRFEDQLFMDWGLATESMTLSALEGDKPQITNCSYWPDHPERIPNGNKEMVWNFDKRPASALNSCYFTLDTTHPYVIVPYQEIERDLR